MFGSGGIQLFQRIAGAPECQNRFDRRLPLRSEHFPVQASGREIVTRARRHHRGSSRSRDERGNRSALERERLERPSGPVGALTGAEDPSLAEESSSGEASTALSRNEQAVE